MRVSVTANREATIRFISDKGEMESVTGVEGAAEIPQKDGKPDVTFVRVEMEDETGEKIFMQPVMFD
jgi:hypothetical protein